MMRDNSQTRRGFLKALGAGAAVLSAPMAFRIGAAEPGQSAPAASAASAATTAPRPNFLVLVSDDMGWGQVGFQGSKIATPNIDRLCREGVNLTQFYVQPVCSPTRACFLTGRFPFRTGTDARFTGNDTSGMLLDERTLAQALKGAGYWTAITGKWHLGAWEKAHLPMQRGFDHQYGLYGAVIDYYLHVRGGVYDWHRNEQPVDEDGYSTDLIADEAIRLIKEHGGGPKPFFLYVPFNAVHSPHTQQAPAEVIAKCMKLGIKGAEQAAQVDCMDVAIGRILAALDEKGLRDNTLVVFFNDNGAPRGIGNLPYNGYKASYLEGGIRVASVMRWPGKIKAGSVVDEPLHVVDLYPTLINLAGGSLEQKLPLDGKDAWPAITEGKPTPHTEIVHSLKTIRVGDWKYIAQDEEYYNWKSEVARLYNVREDPYEKTNLAEKMPKKVKELQARLAPYKAQERPAEKKEKVPWPVLVYGEEESKAPAPEWLRKRVEYARTNGKDMSAKEEAVSVRKGRKKQEE